MHPGAQRKFYNVLLALMFFVLGLSVWAAMVRPSPRDVLGFFTSLASFASDRLTHHDLNDARGFSLPAQTVILIRTPAPPEDPQYIALPGDMQIHGGAVARRAPECWHKIARIVQGRELDEWTAVPFLHAMQTPSGPVRLVAVELVVRFTGEGAQRPGGEFYAAAYSFDPNFPASSMAGSAAHSATLTPLGSSLTGPLRFTRIFAGAVDTRSASRLIIPYERTHPGSDSPTEQGEIIGELADDGTIRLTHGLNGSKF